MAKLTSDSLCSPGWPWIYHPPLSASRCWNYKPATSCLAPAWLPESLYGSYRATCRREGSRKGRLKELPQRAVNCTGKSRGGVEWASPVREQASWEECHFLSTSTRSSEFMFWNSPQSSDIYQPRDGRLEGVKAEHWGYFSHLVPANKSVLLWFFSLVNYLLVLHCCIESFSLEQTFLGSPHPWCA